MPYGTKQVRQGKISALHTFRSVRASMTRKSRDQPLFSNLLASLKKVREAKEETKEIAVHEHGDRTQINMCESKENTCQCEACKKCVKMTASGWMRGTQGSENGT